MSDDGPKLMVILPKADRDAVSNGLRELTEAIVERHPKRHVMGLFGGEFGYGARWDSEVFSMHSFCWCDKEDCPWCDYDEEQGGKQAPNFHHKATGLKVRWYKYIGRSMKAELFGRPTNLCDLELWPEVLAECLASVKGDEG